MRNIRVSEDRLSAQFEPGDGPPVTLSAAEVSGLIRELAEARATMVPGISGRAQTAGPSHQCDSLLWDVVPDAARRGLSLNLFSDGIGWLALSLSRAQIEDLIASIEFALAALRTSPGYQNRRAGVDRDDAPDTTAAPDRVAS